MRVSFAGLSLIKNFESLQLKAYVCPAGKLTIGYGHTGADVSAHQTITPQRADQLLAKDLSIFEDAIDKLVKVQLNQHQFDALVSFIYNVGPSAFKGSTMLKLLNDGDYYGASQQFKRWVKGGGKTLNGLVTRRAAEEQLFLS